MGKKHVNKGRFFATAFAIAAVIVGADVIRRDFFFTPDNTITIQGDFKSIDAPEAPSAENPSGVNNTTVQQSTIDNSISYLGYSEISLPQAQLSKGLLTVVNEAYPAADTGENLSALIDRKNEFYSLHYENIEANPEAIDAFNLMMADYNAATCLSDFIVYNTNGQNSPGDSVCSASFAENASGYTFDLAVQGINNILAYDGMDEEAWIIENCANYGFIVRYPQGKEGSTGQGYCPWHLRYVGRVNAAIMRDNGFCLEEYVNWLKNYTIDSAPFVYQLDGVSYELYYTASMGETTPVRIPVTGNYTVSGNNMDGFIIIAVK